MWSIPLTFLGIMCIIHLFLRYVCNMGGRRGMAPTFWNWGHNMEYPLTFFRYYVYYPSVSAVCMQHGGRRGIAPTFWNWGHNMEYPPHILGIMCIIHVFYCMYVTMFIGRHRLSTQLPSNSCYLGYCHCLRMLISGQCRPDSADIRISKHPKFPQFSGFSCTPVGNHRHHLFPYGSLVELRSCGLYISIKARGGGRKLQVIRTANEAPRGKAWEGVSHFPPGEASGQIPSRKKSILYLHKAIFDAPGTL